ncbi:MAG TPA: hypothetical protein VEH31_00340 [Streptosporangiaceae bacterium]|nr:hypothetical protein [Streptosporangiaceae bacterium]
MISDQRLMWPLRRGPARAGFLGLEGSRECLDLGLARCATPYGREDLPSRMAGEPVCHDVVTVTGTCQVGEESGCEATLDEAQVDLQVGGGVAVVGLEPGLPAHRGGPFAGGGAGGFHHEWTRRQFGQ